METAATGPGMWQAGLALAAVLGLLIVVLKVLQRFQTGSGDASVRLLSTQRLGPRREIQRLRVGDEVHTIYRHEGAMVVLRTEAFDTWEPVSTPAAAASAQFGKRLRQLAAAAGGRPRSTS